MVKSPLTTDLDPLPILWYRCTTCTLVRVTYTNIMPHVKRKFNSIGDGFTNPNALKGTAPLLPCNILIHLCEVPIGPLSPIILHLEIAKGLRGRFPQLYIVKDLCRSDLMSLLGDAPCTSTVSTLTCPVLITGTYGARGDGLPPPWRGKQAQIAGTALAGLNQHQDMANSKSSAAALSQVCSYPFARSARFF